MREVANLFGFGTSAFFEGSIRVMLFLVDLSPEVIKMPSTRAEKERTAAQFEEVTDK